MSNRRIIQPGLIALAILLAALAGWLLVSCDYSISSGSEPPAPVALATPGDTNFTNVYASGDVRTGDDVIVGDDLTLTDDVTVGGDIDVTGDLSVGNGTPNTTLNGEDAYIEGTLEVDGALNFDGAADFASTIAVAGNISDGDSAVTIADNFAIDGAADAVQMLVQEYYTPTSAAFVVESSNGTDVAAITVAPLTAGSFDLLDLTDTMAIQDGTDTVIGIDVNLTGANHTGSSNYIYGIDLDLTTADAQATEAAIELTDTDWDVGIYSVEDLEHFLLPSIASEAIITTTDGALWTAGATEVWFIHGLYCHITTNFDCDGDDCIIHIGDGNDEDGFLDLDDGELQTSDTEGTGAPAGWQGFMSTDTVGAYLTNGLGFVYTNDTIDIKIEDSSGHTDPTAGAATCYLIYTRLQ